MVECGGEEGEMKAREDSCMNKIISIFTNKCGLISNVVIKFD